MSSALRFLVPSTIGVLFFLTPVPWDGGQQILVGVLANSLDDAVGTGMPFVINALFLTSAIGSCIATLLQPRWLLGRPLLREVFVTTAPWLALRVLGGVFSTLVAWQFGPQWVIGPDTGQVAYVELAGLIFCIMLVANGLLPLLAEYGFLDLVGTLLSRFFARVFRLPGRAALDALTSWVGDSSVGALLTIKQYQSGHYTAREAAVVVTNFSAVSLPFCVVIAQIARIDQMFVTFYLSATACALLCALITPRLPPLSRIADTRLKVASDADADSESESDAAGVLRSAWANALRAADRGPGAAQILRHATRTIFDIYMAVLPAAMTIEFLALVLVTYTDLLTWLSLPMLPLLYLLQVPEPMAVLPGTLIGFFDQFIPAIISADIDNPISRFVLAGLSVTQLIFIAENGILILRSPIPLSLGQLAAVFLLRTLISLPPLTLMAHLLF